MATMNKTAKGEKKVTHGGALASHISVARELERTVMAHMLFEDGFYENGESVTSRLSALIAKTEPIGVLNVALRARKEQHLRHVPLFLVAELERQKKTHNAKGMIPLYLSEIIQRPDELTEFLSLYWRDKKVNSKKTPPLTKAVKKGLAKAFAKFDAYQLAKYNNMEKEYKLRDVYRLVHPTTDNEELFATWVKLLKNELPAPDTWEVQLSAGKDKKETFTRLINERKLGVMALLRNLRGMQNAGVEDAAIRKALKEAKPSKVLPFRFITAAKHAPKFEPELEQLMFRCLEGMPKLEGKTILVVDVSGSMTVPLSTKSEISRMESAFALAMMARELCEEVAIYVTAGNDYSRVHKTKLMPPRRGFGLADIMRSSYGELGGGGIFLTQCMDYIDKQEKGMADRVIVFTDEQDCDVKANPDKAKLLGKNNYMVNIATYQNGIGYGKWTKIDGFSEQTLNYIQAFESNGLQ